VRCWMISWCSAWKWMMATTLALTT